MADSRTVGFNDLIAVEHRYPDRTGFTVGVRHRPAQRYVTFLTCFRNCLAHIRNKISCRSTTGGGIGPA